MRIILAQSTAEANEAVASIVYDKLQGLLNPVIGLATGRTMEPVYKILVQKVRARPLNLKQSFFFMLDEYVGLPKNHVSSFKSYIDQHVRLPLGLSEDHFAFPSVHVKDFDESAQNYERAIRESSGIDLQLLGVGQNGHVGFNEPGSSKNSRTRLVKLSPSTLVANRPSFQITENLPAEAISMGIGTIMEAKELVMLATGKNKADVIKYLVNHHNDDKCPVTYLKSHAHFVLVLDPEAASKINLNI